MPNAQQSICEKAGLVVNQSSVILLTLVLNRK